MEFCATPKCSHSSFEQETRFKSEGLWIGSKGAHRETVTFGTSNNSQLARKCKRIVVHLQGDIVGATCCTKKLTGQLGAGEGFHKSLKSYGLDGSAYTETAYFIVSSNLRSLTL